MCLVVRVTFARGTSSRIILNKLALDSTKDDKVSSPVWKQLAEIINKRWASKLSDNDAFQVTTRDVAQAPGYMVSSFPGVMFGPLYFRQLERDQTEALKCNKGVFYAFTISEWWFMHVDSSYNAISHGEPTKVSFFSELLVPIWFNQTMQSCYLPWPSHAIPSLPVEKITMQVNIASSST